MYIFIGRTWEFHGHKIQMASAELMDDLSLGTCNVQRHINKNIVLKVIQMLGEGVLHLYVHKNAHGCLYVRDDE